jgi:hypothetical protein
LCDASAGEHRLHMRRCGPVGNEPVGVHAYD